MLVTSDLEQQVRANLLEAISFLCKTKLRYEFELSISGLLAITVDRHEVLLVNVHDVISDGDRKVCLLGDPNNDLRNEVSHAEVDSEAERRKTEPSLSRSERQGTVQHIANSTVMIHKRKRSLETFHQRLANRSQQQQLQSRASESGDEWNVPDQISDVSRVEALPVAVKLEPLDNDEFNDDFVRENCDSSNDIFPFIEPNQSQLLQHSMSSQSASVTSHRPRQQCKPFDGLGQSSRHCQSSTTSTISRSPASSASSAGADVKLRAENETVTQSTVAEGFAEAVHSSQLTTVESLMSELGGKKTTAYCLSPRSYYPRDPTLPSNFGVVFSGRRNVACYKPKQRLASSNGAPVCCNNCGTTKTTAWRRCPDDQKLLCNACGCYYKLHRVHRPQCLARDEIKSRTRIRPRYSWATQSNAFHYRGGDGTNGTEATDLT